ncbi:ABC transporter permease [Umezawaea sp. NPDC059074]|uniref:ABC transporter permease n=1 Tax=Umezawaea sp. NPDC059074 TaxID=3346716 RepID=UPI0036A13298
MTEALPVTAPRRRTLLTPDRVEDGALLGVLLALAAFFGVASPYYLTAGNLTNLLMAVSVVGTIAAVGTLILTTGALDLSVGSAAALSAVSTVWFTEIGRWPVGVAILGGLLIGLAGGFFNGVFSVVLGVNPIITTIGALSVFRGIAYVITDGSEILVRDDFLLGLGSGRLLGVPYSVLVMLAAFGAAAFVARYTVVGRNLFAIGANPRASLLAGLPIGRYQIGIFAVSGLFAAVGGILLVGMAGSAASGAATTYEFQVITAVLLGGTSILGGTGRIRGTFLAVLIVGTLNNGMVLLAVPSYYQTVASGLMLLVAVALATLRQRFKRSGRRR